jgi:pimeloyl-ACP methyl ester carboxylesterase
MRHARKVAETLVVALALASTSCTDLLLARYRNEALLADYKYRLGEEYLEADGIRFCYQEHGQGEPLVILPGLGTSIDFWQLNVPTLAEHFHVFAVDLPGFGKSDKPDVSYDLMWLTDQVLAFMDAKHIERADFIGGSMGGHIALLLALHHPERVDRLVIMGSSGTWNQWLVADHLRRMWPHIYWSLTNRRPPMTHALFDYQMALRADGRRFAREGRACARALRSIFYHSCRHQLQEIQAPVLLIWGEDDPIHPLKSAEYFATHLPHARLVLVPGAAHEVMIDDPELFNDEVIAFLRAPGNCRHRVADRVGRRPSIQSPSRRTPPSRRLQDCHDAVTVISRRPRYDAPRSGTQQTSVPDSALGRVRRASVRERRR